MKILHTSDWHLGHRLYDYDRTDEQLHTLRRIREIVECERPDLFLLCGDVFDTAKPTFRTQQMFVDYLDALRRDFPEMEIVVIAGNHDSASLHEVFVSAWNSLNITVVGSARKETDEALAMAKVIAGKCMVVPVPYFVDRTDCDYLERLLRAVEERNTGGLPVVLMLHTAVDGCNFSGHDNVREGYIGGIRTIDGGSISAKAAYVALGHIHCPQTIGGNMRYCGSPMPISFDEDFAHSVSIVTLLDGAVTEIREVEIEPLIPLLTIPEKGRYIAMDEAIKALGELDAEEDVYVRLNIDAVGPLSPLDIDKAYSICSGGRVRLCNINRAPRDCSSDGNTEKYLQISEFKEIPPVEVARMYADAAGIELTADSIGLIQEIADEIAQTKREEL